MLVLSPGRLLDVSRDGGRTWVDARLPGLVGDTHVTDTLVAPPIIDGALGALAVELGSSSPGGFRFYRTTDGGLSWVQAGAIAENDVASVSVAVINPTHFVALDPEAGTVSSTSDAGVTWVTEPMTGFTQPLRLNFWDPEQGGAIALLAMGLAPRRACSRRATMAERGARSRRKSMRRTMTTS